MSGRYEKEKKFENRIIEKFNLKPNWYKWTKRQPPTYLTIER